MVNGLVAAYAAGELSTAEQSRTSPDPPGQEQAARAAYLARALGGGAYPLLAGALADGAPRSVPEAAYRAGAQPAAGRLRGGEPPRGS
ncbi:hypothetical protein [Streptomyces sp. H27-D2]|uniref:hypothetical protein n=1 Tax=Streptomyces sp. H27-D2 TaxID=3046304 RepID=UPI002DB683C5|nr:hypothetical protein [Streptomyces sp. H27-D2]MEC4018544.1 hypothetical protein [Streptomyces sp. H27-D2]